MNRNFLLVLLFGIAPIWFNLSKAYCPYSSQSYAIPNNSTGYYNSNASSSCLDVAQFPLSSCLTGSAGSVFRSSSAVAAPRPGDPIGGGVYQATFNPSDWSGQLLAYNVDRVTGILSQTALWDAGLVLTSQGSTSLNLYSFYHPDMTSIRLCGGTPLNCSEPSPILSGMQFTYDNFTNTVQNKVDPTQCYQTASGDDYLFEYFAGSQGCETNTCPSHSSNCSYSGIPSAFNLRSRTRLLGDLVNSDPLFVGSELFGYSNIINSNGFLPEDQIIPYQTFFNNKSQVDANGNSPRPRMVYVGSNDGRLHGFRAGQWKSNIFDTGDGTELFSFFPGSVMNYDLYLRSQASLTTQNPLNHRYLVDGSPMAGDAYFNGSWHTVLLGTTGASSSGATNSPITGVPAQQLDNGGSIFALDITYPQNFTQANKTWINQSNPNNTFTNPNVLWEFTNNPQLLPQTYSDNRRISNVVTINWADGDLGLTLSQPTLARMQNGTWAAIVGNGYNSQNQLPVLYILAISSTSDDKTWTPQTPQSSNFIIAKFSPCVSNTSISTATVYPPTTNVVTNSNCLSGGSPKTPNGLSSPIAVDVDGDTVTDYIYAGDLQGNLWKFDVNCSNYSKGNDDLNCQMNSSVNSTDYWQVANGGKPLFVTHDYNSAPQPITAKPQVGSVSAIQANAIYNVIQGSSSPSQKKSKASVMVYFGTGSYLGLCDLASSSTLGVTCPQLQQFQQQQTFYALWDKNIWGANTDNSIAGRGNLLQQTITNASSIYQNNTNNTPVTNVRVTSNNNPCYQTPCTSSTTNPIGNQQLGWYMDLSTPSNNPSERSVSFPTLLNGNIVFTTQLPTSNPCSSSQSGWVMELNAITGGAPTPTNPAFLNIFGTNSSGNSPSNDLVSVSNGSTVAPSGIQSTVGILKTPTLVYGPGVVHKYFGGSIGLTGSTTGIQMITDPGLPLGRVSWRQLR